MVSFENVFFIQRLYAEAYIRDKCDMWHFEGRSLLRIVMSSKPTKTKTEVTT